MDDARRHNDRSDQIEQGVYEDVQQNVPYREYAPAPESPPHEHFAQQEPPEMPQTLVGAEISDPASAQPVEPARRRQRRLWYVLGAVLLVLLIIGGAVIWFIPKIASTPSPFRTAKCPFALGAGMTDGKTVTCGYLTVPQDYSQPHGKTIQLAVATFKAGQAQTSTTPFLYLTGGPGGGVLNDLGSLITSDNMADVGLGHDLILLDQRGTGYSKPALNCPEVDDLAISTLDQNVTRQQSTTLYVQAMQKCHDRLVKAGINLNDYTTIANATDVHMLIQALGYQQVDLYGVSYGTRLAQTVMRLFPSDLHSVTLDSTVPTQLNLYNTIPAATQHAYDTLFQGCASNPSCAAKYPSLDSVFYKLVDTLNTSPITFQDPKYGPVLLNGDSFANWLFTAQYVTNLIPDLPEIIVQVQQGDYNALSQLYSELELNQGISYGMYYSVECGEDMAYTTLPVIQQATAVMHPEVRPGMFTNEESDYQVCKIWGQKPVPAVQKQAVKSTVPTLILSGEYDPITPAANGRLVAKSLKQSYFVLFPATGHGVFLTASCPDSIMAAFMQHPAQQPAESCVSTSPEPDFQ